MEYGLHLIKEKKQGLHIPYLRPLGGTLSSRHFWTLWVAGRLGSSSGQSPVEGGQCEWQNIKHTEASGEWH